MEANTSLPTDDEVQKLITLFMSRRLEDAETTANRLIETFPDAFLVRNVLGATLAAQGRFDEAIGSYKAALGIKPDYAEAHNNLGAAYKALGQFEDAIASYRNSVAANAEFAEAHSNLGAVYQLLGRLEEAADSCRKSVGLEPTFIEDHNNLGVVLQELGRPDEAAACYRNALRIKPDFALAHNNLGNLHERNNRLDDAASCTERAVAISPDDPAINLSRAVLLRRRGQVREAIQLLKPYAGASDPVIRARINSELGRLCDRDGDAKAAFSYFLIANDLQAGSAPARAFDKRRFLANVSHVRDVVTPGWISGWKQLSPAQETDALAFIVGFPRSGTTLLDQILDSHPGIQVMEEKPVINELVAEFIDSVGPYPAALSTMSDEQAADLRVSYRAHVERFLHRDPGSLLVDKFPLNIVHVPLIVRLFPSARIILALRHPCDVVLSNFMQHYRVNTAMANFFTISDSVHCYQEVMGLWLTVADLLDFSHRSVRYESLVTDFDTEVGALIEFLGVGWDDAVNDYARHARERGIIDTPSYQDVTEPINRRALYRWERYSDELGTAVDSLAPFAEAFGYDTI